MADNRANSVPLYEYGDAQGDLAGVNGVATYDKAGADAAANDKAGAQAMNVYDGQHYLVPSEVGTAKRGADNSAVVAVSTTSAEKRMATADCYATP